MYRFDPAAKAADVLCDARTRRGIERLRGNIVPHHAQHVFFRDDQMTQTPPRGLCQLQADTSLRAGKVPLPYAHAIVWNYPVTQALSHSKRPPEPHLHLVQGVALCA